MANPDEIFQWRRLDHRLTTSGQPSEAQLAGIAALGVSHVVNLGLHSHERALPEEGASVAALGMAYVHIPVDFNAPTETDFALFSDTMDALDGRIVHVHCIANLRVSAFLYRYQRDALGCDEGAARAAMEDVWKPGGVWAGFIGDAARTTAPHRYAKRDY